jgi:cellulose synthase/poly-beta-1,6-N-acetylglucosamine synthase-like glycosyltransferase
MISLWAALAFWVSLGAVLFTYIGYPVLVWFLARWFGRRPAAPADDGGAPPSVSLLIAAYNEAGVIDGRLQNALALDYPKGRLEIVVASDGSVDATARIVQGFAGRGVRLFHSPQRRGKAAALNDAFPRLTGDIVLLSDANTFTDSSALRRIVRWFRDPAVGVVCGRLVLTDPRTGRNADSLYWKYETFLKRCENRLGALLGSNGAIYAIRRVLFAPIPEQTILDDFVIPLQAKLRTGCRIVYECEAVAREETPADIRAEFRRRSRIGAGGFQSIGMLWKLLDPRRGWVALSFFAHKVLRWLCPFFLIGMAAANLLLCDQPLYCGLLFAQVGFYLASLLAGLVPAEFRSLKPLRLSTMFTSMNLALLLGFWRWLRGTQRATWQTTLRPAPADGAGVGAAP